MNRLSLLAPLAAIALGLASTSPSKAASDVVVSIKPIHSLVAGVMEGVGEPHLIVKGGSSPHTYALKPSDAEALEHAKVVFWIGDSLETFLQGPLETLAKNAKVVELADSHGLTKLGLREGGTWEGHDHGDHAEHGHDDHAKSAHSKHDHDKHGHDDHAKSAHAKHDHDKHGHDDHAKSDHGKHDHDKHGHDKHAHGAAGHDDVIDAHLWLDPVNAKAMVHEIAEALAKADPANAKAYAANERKVSERLDKLIASMKDRLAPVTDRPFVVFHDAYHYLENRFGLNGVGSITVSPEVQPGAKRLAEIKGKIGELGAVCVFAEPQFEPKLVGVVTEGTKAKTGMLDPLGADLPDGADLYFALMERNAKSLTECLGKTS